MRPGANLVPFYKERKRGKNCEEKVGKSKAKEKTLILQPPVPSFLWGWGLPGLIQQQLYNVFFPFNRLHQHTRVYSLQLQTVAVSNKSVFNCGCCEGPWCSSISILAETYGRTQKNNLKKHRSLQIANKRRTIYCTYMYYRCIGNSQLWIH